MYEMKEDGSRSVEGQSAFVVALVGDSDIERWPKDLLPAPSSSTAPTSSGHHLDNSCHNCSVRVYGESGATLNDTLSLATSALEEAQQSSPVVESLLMVFCAGENDISQGIRLDKVLHSFQQLLKKSCLNSTPGSSTIKKLHLLVLGPKFEPWLEYDASVRKQYVKLSQMMERACNNFDTSSQSDSELAAITYVDCLVMFCGESGQLPGALLGGKAIPDKQYFDYDLLHLSREGYGIWKRLIEDYIAKHF